MKKYSFEIEKDDGSTLLTFEVEVVDNEIKIGKVDNCDLADITNDYFYENEKLYRIQNNEG